MRAAWYHRVGSASDVLTIGELPDPEPGPSEVLVRVRASGVNPSDTKHRAGWRGAAMTFPRVVPHGDGAGEIVATGADVPSTRVGERVWVYNAVGLYDSSGAFGTAAELCVVPTNQAISLPGGVSLAAGACFGIPATTAHRAVYADGPVAGFTVLVHGGAGAVGHCAVQMAKLGGARVIATVSSPEKAAHAEGAGADVVIDRRHGDVTAQVLAATSGRGVDRIIEVDLGANLSIDVEVLAVNGIIASYSSTAVPEPVFPYYPLAFKGATVRLVQAFNLPAEARADAIRDITDWAGTGKLQIAIAVSLPLDEIARAHELVERGLVIGNVVVVP